MIPFGAGLDLASVHGAVVGLAPTLTSYPRELACTAPPKEEVPSPLRDLAMAQKLYESVRAVLPPGPESRFSVLAVEHTPFMAKQAGAAMTGVVRGALYAHLREVDLYDMVFLVNPSQWRSYHQIKATGSAKWEAYALKAEEYGFVSKLEYEGDDLTPAKRRDATQKMRNDATAAFLIGCVALTVARLSAYPEHERHLLPHELKAVNRIDMKTRIA